MCFKVQLILLLFGVEMYYGHTLTKIQINNGTDVYEVNELPNKTVEFVNPEAKEPTLREIIYYRVIERPYITKNSEQERITKESDREEPDFDETLRPFTNSQGYQFLDWGAQEEKHPDDDNNTTVAANNNEKNKTNDYYDEYDDKVNDDADVKTKGDISSSNNDDDYNSMEIDEKSPIKNHENDKDVYNDDYFDEEIDKKNKENDKDDVFYNDDDSNEKSGNSTKIDVEDESQKKVNETVTDDNIDVKDKNDTNDNHGKDDKKINHTDDIAMKLRSQLFNSTKEKYHNIKRHHKKPVIVNRRKREINYKNLPEAPVLPDLDLSVLPDYLQKMLKKRLGLLKTNKHTDNNLKVNKEDDKENYYNLPEPEIEIRNNFNDEEELSKNKEEIKSIERTKRKSEDNLKSSNVDKLSDFDMKDKLKAMFDSIEDTFTKDGKKPRTYGMKLKGNTGEIWNDVAGAPSISVHDPRDIEEDEVIDPKNNEVDYDNDSAEEDNTSNNLNNEDLDYYGDMHSEEPSKDNEKAIENGGTTEIPKELNINSTQADLPDFKIDHIEQIPRINKKTEGPENQEYSRKLAESELPDVKIDHIDQIPRINKKLEASEREEYARKLAESDLPDVKIDHIEQIPRINKELEASEREENARKLAESELPDVKIDHIEQIPRINKEVDESVSQENDNKLLSELPDLKIEHTEQIPRTYGKTEAPTTIDVTTKKHEIYDKENLEMKPETIPKKPLNKIEKESGRPEINKDKLPINKNLEDKIEESFDNVIKQFKSLEPTKQKPKAVDFDNIEGSKDTYGLNLEGYHGYIWNGVSKSGRHVNVGNIENVPTAEPSSEIANIKDPVKEQKEKDNELTAENPKETIKDKSKEGIQDKESVDKEKELKKKNDTKLALEDLLKKDEFWKWLSNWTTTYMEVLEERNEKFIKNEVTRQLGQKNNDLDKKKANKSDNDQRKNEKSNVDKKETNSTMQNVTEDKNSTDVDKSKEHIHENNKTLPYNINADTIYGSAAATDHVTNIFIFYPETENNKSEKNVPVLHKDKFEAKLSDKMPGNLSFDERLGSNEDDELKETDDATTKSPKNETTNITTEASTKISIPQNDINNLTVTEATKHINKNDSKANNDTVTTSIDGLTTTGEDNSETETANDATETTTVVTDKNATDGLTTTEVYPETETTTGIETTTVITDKDATATESSDKEPTEGADDKSKEAVTTDATKTVKADS